MDMSGAGRLVGGVGDRIGLMRSGVGREGLRRWMDLIEMLLEGRFQNTDQLLGVARCRGWKRWVNGFEEVADKMRRRCLHLDGW